MEQIVSELFSQYAYSPMLVYGAIVLFMMMSAFGLPIPEEVVLISAGFIGYMSLHPDKFPPPYPGAPSVNVHVLAFVALAAVMGSDYLIYYLGERFGPKLFKMRWFARLVSEASLEKIQRWTRKHGYWAVFVFRFTPGVRFPGHLMCGAMGLSRWKFLGVDAIAAGISVPTQILLVSTYGEVIYDSLLKFKQYVFIGGGCALIIWFAYKMYQRRAIKSLSAK
ncbi:MAG: DedA family protein [Bdellovibrionota bacterium]